MFPDRDKTSPTHEVSGNSSWQDALKKLHKTSKIQGSIDVFRPSELFKVQFPLDVTVLTDTNGVKKQKKEIK